MMFPHIRCYNSAHEFKQHVFYILAKGNNAGKPSFKPWPNSFSVICTTKESFDFFFWLAYGLWKADKFKCHQRGTAIQFINISDVQKLFEEVGPAIHEHWQKYQQIVLALGKLEKKKISLAEEIMATEKLQSYLIRNYFMRNSTKT